MAAEIGRQDPALTPLQKHLIGGEEYRFSFFQAIRLLERIFEEGHAPLGYGTDPTREVVRIRGRLSLGFPAAEVHSIGFDPERDKDLDPADPRQLAPGPIDWNRPKLPIDVTVTFMGLFGTLGVLPLHYTTLLRRRVRQRDHALRDFLDLFNHRMLSLFYRAWEKHSPAVGRERAFRHPTSGSEPLANAMSALAGIATPGLQARLSFPDGALLRYAGLLASRTRSRDGLEAMLRDYFEPVWRLGESPGRLAELKLWPERRPLRVEPFACRMCPLPLEEQTELGAYNDALGESFVLGDEVAVEDAGLRIIVGPLSLSQFCEFLPPRHLSQRGDAFQCLVELVRLFCGPEVDFDVQLLLRRNDARGFELSEANNAAPRLGISTWIINQPPQDVLAESIYSSTLAEGHKATETKT